MGDWIDLLRGGPDPSSVGDAFRDSYRQARSDAQAQRIFEQQQAGRSAIVEALKGGDYKSAAALGFAYGDDKAGTGLTTLDKNAYDQRTGGNTSFANVAAGLGSLPYEQRRAAIQAIKPQLVAGGVAGADIDAFDPTDDNLTALSSFDYSAKDRESAAVNATNATANLNNSNAAVTNANNPVTLGEGQSLVTRGGQVLARGQKTVVAPLDSNVLTDPGVSSNGYTSVTSGTGSGGAPRSYGPVTAEQLYFGAIRPQESSNGKNLIGPQTKYGRALGAGQTLPATAKAMAARLGLPWRPELLTQKTPDALAYQDKLGVAYAQEALDASGGDPRKAAAYYYGGPDLRQHGPRTRRYADEVMARFDQAMGTQATQTPTGGGFHIVQQGVPKPVKGGADKQRSMPQGTQKTYEGQVAQWQGLNTALRTFDPKFAGNTLTGNLENSAQSLWSGFGTPGQRNWWAQFNSIDNVIRHDLYGSALTDNERALYDRTSISPKMDPKIVQQNLHIREQLVAKALGRKQKFLVDEGYRPQGILDLAGRDFTGGMLGGGATPTSTNQAAIPPAAAAALRAGHGTAAQFDAVFGAGAAARVLGR